MMATCEVEKNGIMTRSRKGKKTMTMTACLKARINEVNDSKRLSNQILLFISRFVFWLGISCCLAACAGQVETPPILKASATVTQTVSPTATPQPTITQSFPTNTPIAVLTPTPTSFTGFKDGEGPHLLIQNYPADLLSIYTPDGRQSILQLPDRGKIYDLRQSLSPNGSWLAFFTGSFDPPGSGLVLNLLSLKNGRTIKVSSLLAEGFPENMRPIARDLVKKNIEPGITEEGWLEILQRDFPMRVMTVAWSPDSQQLAFAGQIDGPSSDIYIYDMASAKIHRKVDDLENAAKAEWSPDGKWLAFMNLIPGSVYTGETLSVVRTDTSIVRQPRNYKDFWSMGEGWLSPKHYLITGHGDGGPSMNIRVLNVETSQVISIWPDVYYDFAFDPEHQQFLISGEPEKRSENSETVKIGVYLVQLDGRRQKIMDGEIDNLLYLGWKGAQFVGTRPDELLTINLNGSLNTLSTRDGKLAVYPDRKWLLHYNVQQVDLYAEPGHLIRSIPSSETINVLWTADSRMVWMQGKTLFSLAIPQGDLSPVKCFMENCETNLSTAVWVQ